MDDEALQQPPADSTQDAPSLEDRDDGEVLVLEEAVYGSRLSPFAIAALVISGIGLWLSPQAFFPPFDGFGWKEIILGHLPQALPSIAASAVAIWAASRAREEIAAAKGRLGGVGLYRSGLALAAATLAVIAVSMAVRFLGVYPYGPPENEVSEPIPEDEGIVEFDDVPPPPGLPETPVVPAPPARPAP